MKMYDLAKRYMLILRLLALVLLAGTLLVVVHYGNLRQSSGAMGKNPENAIEDLSFLSLTEMDTDTDMSAPEELALTDGVMEITQGGDYHVTGSMTGTLVIEAQEQNVHLFLDGARIRSRSGPAVYCESAGKLVITLVDGSRNIISDSGDYDRNEDIEACIYSNCDITFNGGGSLSVSGYYKDAVRSKDVVKIAGGTYTIKCKRSAFRGNDGIYASNGTFDISSEENAFKTTKRGINGRGCIVISGGEYNIVSGRYSFIATKGDLYIFNCSVTDKSVIGTFDVGGRTVVQEGCIR